MKFSTVFTWFRSVKSKQNKLTEEEIKEIAKSIYQENPDGFRKMISKLDEFIEAKKEEFRDKRMVDVILQGAESLSEKYRLNNIARIRTIKSKLEQAQKLDLSETEIVENALNASFKVVQNEKSEKLYSICQETVSDFSENLEMYLDLLGEPLESEPANPLQPYTLQILPSEKRQFMDESTGVGNIKNLVYRGEKLAMKLQVFVKTRGADLIEYHYELLYANLLLELRKELSDKQLIPDANGYPEKIDWLGTQKQLAELFVELQRKGWINEIPTKLIKKYFSKADTIDQALKPARDAKTGEATYEGIFTKAYKPSFDVIRKKAD